MTLDPIRCGHAIDGLLELVKLHPTDLERVDAGAADLLRRMDVTWKQLLVHPVRPADPLPVRQANVMACVIYQYRGHAQAGDLALAAIWHRVAPRDPQFAEDLRTLMSRCQLAEEAQLEALRVAIETGDTATMNAICDRRQPFLDEPLPEPPAPTAQDVLGDTLIGSAVEGAR